MFCVIFEVQPKPERWDAYLEYAKLLRPELAQMDGFIDNTRYRAKHRPGVVLSLSTRRDEKALVRWRTHALHHEVQKKGRSEIFQDYHLRVGEVTADNQIPEGQVLREQRRDETEIGRAKVVSLIEAKRPMGVHDDASAEEIASILGLPVHADGLVDWGMFEAILTPSDLLLLLSWRVVAAADTSEPEMSLPIGTRHRRVRVVRDYGMSQRREAPQYYSPVNNLSDSSLSGIRPTASQKTCITY